MSAWVAPGTGELVTCETVVAITLHVRRVGDREVRLGGHVTPRPRALCGSEVAWDCRIPVSAVRCRICIAAMKEGELVSLKDRASRSR